MCTAKNERGKIMKKVFSLFLPFCVLSYLILFLCGCSPVSFSVSATDYTSTISDSISNVDQQLIQHIGALYEDENYVVSPLSLHCTMAMATMGMEGKTQKEMLDFYGLNSLDEFYSYASLAENYKKQFEDIEDAEFRIANSVWYNKDQISHVNKTYSDAISKYFGGLVQGEKLSNLPDAINSWVGEQTNGSLDSIVNDMSPDTVFALVNAVFVNDIWEENAMVYNSGENNFTAVDGTVTKKEFVNYTGDALHYKDSKSEIVDITTKNGLHIAFVLGDNTNVYGAIAKASSGKMSFRFPKTDIFTSLAPKDILSFFSKNEKLSAFQGGDFSGIVNTNAIITDILQETQVQLSEVGLTASSGSAAIGTLSGFDLTLNQPFSFYVYADEGEGAYCTLFFGKVNK